MGPDVTITLPFTLKDIFGSEPAPAEGLEAGSKLITQAENS